MSVTIDETEDGAAIINLRDGKLVITTKCVATATSCERRIEVVHRTETAENTGELTSQEADVLASVLETVSEELSSR